jgi:radical SAM-linked protein
MTQRLAITFRKSGTVRFLSHLDLLATLEFAVRRARLPVALAEGFNPRPRMSLAAPLPLGHSGERELLEITLKKEVELPHVRRRLAAALPEGIEILEVQELPPGLKSAASRVESVSYRIDLTDQVDDLETRVAGLLGRPAIEIQEERDGTVRARDVRPLILELRARGDRELAAILRLGEEGTVRPEQVLSLLEIPTDGAAFTRESVNLRGNNVG